MKNPELENIKSKKINYSFGEELNLNEFKNLTISEIFKKFDALLNVEGIESFEINFKGKNSFIIINIEAIYTFDYDSNQNIDLFEKSDYIKSKINTEFENIIYEIIN